MGRESTRARPGLPPAPAADLKMKPAERKLLVIEDEAAILQFLRSSLEASDWVVIEARTGRLGLELAAREKPAAVLLDLGLPDGDGLQVLKALRRWTSAPVIIISARGQESDKVSG